MRTIKKRNILAHSQFCVLLLVLCCWFSLRLWHIAQSFQSKYEILVWSETVPISFSFILIINLDFMSWNRLQCSRECCCLVFWPNWLSLPLCLSLWLTLTVGKSWPVLGLVRQIPPCDRGWQIPYVSDDSGAHVRFLPSLTHTQKTHTRPICLPVLCCGPVSVRTAASRLRLQHSAWK